MKLNEIQLHNFGSYEGTNSISFSSDDASKRVTIIGGKHGALQASGIYQKSSL